MSSPAPGPSWPNDDVPFWLSPWPFLEPPPSRPPADDED